MLCTPYPSAPSLWSLPGDARAHLPAHGDEALKCGLVAALLLASMVGLGACRGPDQRPRRLELAVDTSLLARNWEAGPRRDSVMALLERDGRRFARGLFTGEPMPTGMPVERAAAGTIRETLLAAVRHPGKDDKPPSWWKGVPPQPDSFEHDLPREHVVVVERGETPRLLAQWSKGDAKQLLKDNTEILGKRRWLKPGDALKVTMSANQKLAFEQARERFRSDRLEAYFARHYIDRVVVYVVQRGDRVAKVARSYGEVPIWLLEAFNQADFRRLQPGDAILIPVVRELGHGKVPPRLHVVDRDGRALEGEASDLIDQKLPKALLREARVAIDDSSVFERDGAGGTEPARLLPQPGMARAPVQAPPQAAYAAPPPPPVAAPAPPQLREVIVKSGETHSHYSSWSGLRLDQITRSNPGLDPKRLHVGHRIKLPLTDLQYADFLLMRSSGGRPQGAVAALAAGAVAPPPPPRAAALPRPERKPLPAVIAGAQAAMSARALAARGPGSVPAQGPGSVPGPAGAVTSHPPKANGPASLPSPEAAPVEPERRLHIVEPGDTAGRIAQAYGISMKAMQRANPGRNLDRLYVGDELVIPTP